jgi:hypothetical protein
MLAVVVAVAPPATAFAYGTESSPVAGISSDAQAGSAVRVAMTYQRQSVAKQKIKDSGTKAMGGKNVVKPNPAPDPLPAVQSKQ